VRDANEVYFREQLGRSSRRWSCAASSAQCYVHMRRRHRQDAPSAVIDVCFAILRYSGVGERTGVMMGGRLKICVGSVATDTPSDTRDSTFTVHDRLA